MLASTGRPALQPPTSLDELVFSSEGSGQGSRRNFSPRRAEFRFLPESLSRRVPAVPPLFPSQRARVGTTLTSADDDEEAAPDSPLSPYAKTKRSPKVTRCCSASFNFNKT